jgi:hypothetical protein
VGWHQGEVNKQCLFPPQERFEGGPCWDSIAERLKLRLRLNPLNVKVECVYIPKFCYLKVNKIRPDKPITVPAQGYFILIPRCFSSQIPPWRWTKPAHLSVSYMSSLI